MGPDSTGYKIVFILHLLTVIVGFGSVMLNGVYASQSRRRGGSEGHAISVANFEVSTKWAEKFIYVAPLFGLALVGMSNGVWSFGQVWVWLSMVLYVVAIGIATGVMVPITRRINALQAELVIAGPGGGGPPTKAAELEALGKRAAATGAILNVAIVVLVVLMVFKPGT